VSPAAGPLTLSGEPLVKATTVPPTIPEIIPENNGAPEAKAIPKQSGNATKNTTKPAGKSFFKYLNVNPLGMLIDVKIKWIKLICK
jgi:hypothetical protein